MISRRKWLLALLPLLIGAAIAQAPNFEVASIRPNKSGDHNSTWCIAPGGRFTGENVSVKGVIMTAYRLKESQLIGATGWIDSETYDIVTKAEGNPSLDELMDMLQGLLADRFKLKYHRLEKEMPVFALVTAKGGAKITESKPGSCLKPGTGPRPDVPDEKTKYCGTYYFGRGKADGTGITMTQLATVLSDQQDRPVIDRTGLGGIFDVHLEWFPEADGVDTNGDATGPSIFTALEEQLGLRLQSSKELVNMLVIDHIERPSEN